MMSARKRTLRNASVGAALAALVVVFTACEEPFAPPSPVDPPEPPQPPAEQPVVMQDHVTVIAATTRVARVTTNSVSFAAPAQHATGDVLVFDRSSATPNGLLHKVTAVSADRRTVDHRAGDLEDVIESGTLQIGGSLKPSDVTPQSRAMLRDMGIVAGTCRRPLAATTSSGRSRPSPPSATVLDRSAAASRSRSTTAWCRTTTTRR